LKFSQEDKFAPALSNIDRTLATAFFAASGLVDFVFFLGHCTIPGRPALPDLCHRF